VPDSDTVTMDVGDVELVSAPAAGGLLQLLDCMLPEGVYGAAVLDGRGVVAGDDDVSCSVGESIDEKSRR